MARNTLDQDHVEFTSVLEELLSSDLNITAREVARRHSTLSSASSITRHQKRRQLLEEYQNRQAELRQWRSRAGKTSKNDIAIRLSSADTRIAELEATVQALTIGHLGLIAAVAEVGGMSKLLRFYKNFQEIRSALHAASALPESLE